MPPMLSYELDVQNSCKVLYVRIAPKSNPFMFPIMIYDCAVFACLSYKLNSSYSVEMPSSYTFDLSNLLNERIILHLMEIFQPGA